jgi:hypothetical protein
MAIGEASQSMESPLTTASGRRTPAPNQRTNNASCAQIDRDLARMTPTGLCLRENMPFDLWLTMGRRVWEITEASAWWLGDWLIYGEQTYPRRYRLAVEATSLDYQTLRNYAWVARRFTSARRRDALSFQHHAEVAALPEPDQELWLGRAERARWSRNELRRHVAAARRRPEVEGGERSVVCRLEVTTAREDRWREAATIADQPLLDWMIAAVDAAAEAVLPNREASASGS